VSISYCKNEWFLEKGINIKFCVKLGKNVSDTCAVPSKAYGRKAVKSSSIFEWHKQFREGCENMEDERSGHPRQDQLQC
jgi:hypothetical protein